MALPALHVREHCHSTSRHPSRPQHLIQHELQWPSGEEKAAKRGNLAGLWTSKWREEADPSSSPPDVCMFAIGRGFVPSRWLMLLHWTFPVHQMSSFNRSNACVICLYLFRRRHFFLRQKPPSSNLPLSHLSQFAFQALQEQVPRPPVPLASKFKVLAPEKSHWPCQERAQLGTQCDSFTVTNDRQRDLQGSRTPLKQNRYDTHQNTIKKNY